MKHVKQLIPLTLLVAMGAAYAGSEYEQGSSPSFTEMDQNGDGEITQEEARAFPRLQENFEQLDANADGVLTREEIGMGGPGEDEESSN
jgi:Ca2+-binding EF-hand superfamily protein